jgi:hypothetical protein
LTYSLSRLSIGSSFAIEPDLKPGVYAYRAKIESATTPILYIEAMPASDGAVVTMTDGVYSFTSGQPQNPPTANAYTWRYPYLPFAGGTVVIAIALTYDGVTRNYALTIDFTKTT